MCRRMKPGSGEDNPGGGDDKPGDGGDNPGSGGDNPGGGDDKPSGGDNPQEGGDGAGSGQTTIVVQTAAPQAGNDATGNPPVSGGTAQETEKTATSDGSEPKTSDPTPVEIYATVAMIAGLTYLLLYFMEESRGMTEREKEVFVAAFIRWAKKGGRFRRCCAIVAIFCLLVYYHGIGKRMGRKEFNKATLGQVL